jgi:Zn-finger nucleic acid-binding protein
MAHGRETQRYCPDDRTPLAKVNDRGVTIDQCPTCGITVLDPGELQVLINQVASMPGFHTQPAGHFGGHGHRPHRRHGNSDGFLGDFFGGSS